jgi:hypothetical protein
MNKRWTVAAAVVCAVASISAPAFAAGGSGGGGGTGGGTGGGGGAGGGGTVVVAPCGNLTVSVARNSTAGYMEAVGTTNKSCDGLPVNISFVDATPADACTVIIPTFVGLSYFKYGVHPPSRYGSGPIYTSGSCTGTSRQIEATLYDRTTGVVISTASTTWVV